MKSNWFSGPAFLWERKIPSSEEIPNIQIRDPGVKSTVRATIVKAPFSLTDRISRFSSWKKAVGVVSSFKKIKPKTVFKDIFKDIQRKAFKNEITSLSQKAQNAKISRQSSLLRLDPFLDEQGLIRVGGRLEHEFYLNF